MIYLTLFLEFFKIGLFAVGGGFATLPFLEELANKYDWYSIKVLPDMIAISEATPGPIGIKMATYAGYNAAGILGGLVATLAMVLPPFLIILLVSRFLAKFKENTLVTSAFSGLRPAVNALITASLWSICKSTLIHLGLFKETHAILDLLNIPSIILFVALFWHIKKYNWHPVLYIAIAGLVGVIFKFQ